MIDTSDQLTIRQLLSKVAEYNASDLHLSVGMPPVLRVDGKLIPLQEEEFMTADKIKRLVEYFLDDQQKQALEANKELVTSFTFDDRARFTVRVYYQKGYMTLALKFIPETIPPLAQLGLPHEVGALLEQSNGLVIITGPYASGKSTSLASMLNYINTQRAEHIVTIEEPIEYVLTNNKSIIEQREVGRDTPSMEQALKLILGEDVNVVGLSALEQPQTIDLALQCAEDGRMVIAAVHSDSIVKSIQTILNQFPPAEQPSIRMRLADVLQAIVVQRLLPKIGGGRVLATGLLLMTPPIRSVIKEGEIFQLNNILATSREQGMVSIDRSLAALVQRGHIVREDALRAAVDRENVRIMTR